MATGDYTFYGTFLLCAPILDMHMRPHAHYKFRYAPPFLIIKLRFNNRNIFYAVCWYAAGMMLVPYN